MSWRPGSAFSGLATGLCLSVSPEATQAGRPCRVLCKRAPSPLSTTIKCAYCGAHGTTDRRPADLIPAPLSGNSLLGWLTGMQEEVVTCAGRVTSPMTTHPKTNWWVTSLIPHLPGELRPSPLSLSPSLRSEEPPRVGARSDVGFQLNQHCLVTRKGPTGFSARMAAPGPAPAPISWVSDEASAS